MNLTHFLILTGMAGLMVTFGIIIYLETRNKVWKDSKKKNKFR